MLRLGDGGRIEAEHGVRVGEAWVVRALEMRRKARDRLWDGTGYRLSLGVCFASESE